MSAATIQAIIAVVSEVVRIPVEHITQAAPYAAARQARMLVCSISNDAGGFDTKAISEALHGLPAGIIRAEIACAAELFDQNAKFRKSYKECMVYAQAVLSKIRSADLLIKPVNNPYKIAKQIQSARAGSEASQEGLKALADDYLKIRAELNQLIALNHTPRSSKFSGLRFQEKIDLETAIIDVVSRPLGGSKNGDFRSEFINAMRRLRKAAKPLTSQQG